MEIIQKKELENLVYHEEMLGSVSELYTCSFNGKTYVYKNIVFFADEQLELIQNISKINEDYLNLPKYLVLNSFNKPIGYILEYLENYKSLFDMTKLENISTEDKVNVLKDAKEKIIKMHETGIIHCDLHNANIMYKDSDTKIIDFDFCSFNNSKPLFLNNAAQQYLEENKLSYSIDVFLFNLSTISILYDVAFFSILEAQDFIEKLFKNKDQQKIWQKTKQKKELTYDDFLINYY